MMQVKACSSDNRLVSDILFDNWLTNMFCMYFTDWETKGETGVSYEDFV